MVDSGEYSTKNSDRQNRITNTVGTTGIKHSMQPLNCPAHKLLKASSDIISQCSSCYPEERPNIENIKLHSDQVNVLVNLSY